MRNEFDKCYFCRCYDEYDGCPNCGQKIDWSEEGNTRLDLMRECGEEVE